MPADPAASPDVEDVASDGQPNPQVSSAGAGLVLELTETVQKTEETSGQGFSTVRAAGLGLGGILCGLGGFLVWRARRNGP
ncbi:MAG: hypothetical protein R3A46_06575 [Thermomicrobiales bacterium]